MYPNTSPNKLSLGLKVLLKELFKYSCSGVENSDSHVLCPLPLLILWFSCSGVISGREVISRFAAAIPRSSSLWRILDPSLLALSESRRSVRERAQERGQCEIEISYLLTQSLRETTQRQQYGSSNSRSWKERRWPGFSRLEGHSKMEIRRVQTESVEVSISQSSPDSTSDPHFETPYPIAKASATNTSHSNSSSRTVYRDQGPASSGYVIK